MDMSGWLLHGHFSHDHQSYVYQQIETKAKHGTVIGGKNSRYNINSIEKLTENEEKMCFVIGITKVSKSRKLRFLWLRQYYELPQKNKQMANKLTNPEQDSFKETDTR